MDDDRFRPALSKTKLRKLLESGWIRVFDVQSIQPREILKRRAAGGFEYIIYPEQLLLRPDGVATEEATPFLR